MPTATAVSNAPSKPVPLFIVQFFLAAFGVEWCVMAVKLLVVPGAIDVFPDVRLAFWMSASHFALGALLVTTALGLVRSRSWARPLLVSYTILQPVSMMFAPTDNGWFELPPREAIIAWSIVIAATAAYLYLVPNVRAYFNSLSR